MSLFLAISVNETKEVSATFSPLSLIKSRTVRNDLLGAISVMHIYVCLSPSTCDIVWMVAVLQLSLKEPMHWSHLALLVKKDRNFYFIYHVVMNVLGCFLSRTGACNFCTSKCIMSINFKIFMKKINSVFTYVGFFILNICTALSHGLAILWGICPQKWAKYLKTSAHVWVNWLYLITFM